MKRSHLHALCMWENPGLSMGTPRCWAVPRPGWLSPSHRPVQVMPLPISTFQSLSHIQALSHDSDRWASRPHRTYKASGRDIPETNESAASWRPASGAPPPWSLPRPPGAPWALAAPGTSAVCASLAVEAGGMLRKRVWSRVTQLVAALCWISQDVATGTAELL